MLSRRKKAHRVWWAFLYGVVWRWPTFALGWALSLAYVRFTVLFGMGRGGSKALWSSDCKREVDYQPIYWKKLLCDWCVSRTALQGYRIKPHGQLVLVSLTHYCASTPSLSTSWSRTTLKRDQVTGKSNLETSFPLRCFQRLSLP